MSATRAAAAPAARTSGPAALLLVAAIVLTAVNLRTAVTSVGPLLPELERGIGLSSALAGLLTTLPVLCFAALGWVTPALAHRVGEPVALTGAMVLMTAGLALRALAGSPVAFLLLSVLALAGGAMGNVLLPALVKHHFPDRIGPMTAAYTTSLAVGTTLAAAGTIPLAGLHGGDDWRLGLGGWAVLSGIAVLPWLGLLRTRTPVDGPAGARSGSQLLGSRTAWAMAAFFGAQSMQAYIAFGWFAQFYRERAGVSAARAGLLVAFLAALSIPVSVVVPSLAARLRSPRPLVLVFAGCYLAAYTGMLVAPGFAGAWVWALLAGLAQGAFPLVLTLVGLRSRTADTTAALSAFTQSIGYVIAGVGPLLVGVLRGATGSWGGPFVLLFAALAALVISGSVVSRPRVVEDDLTSLGVR